MEIKSIRDSTLLLKGKTASLILDPQTISIGEEVEGEIKSSRLVISGPGEYEVKGVKILGVAAGERTNYEIKIDGLKLAIIHGKITEKYEEVFSDLDVLLLSLPVDGPSPQELVLKLEPKIVVVYKTEDPTKFLKDIGREGVLPSSRLVVKKDSIPAELEAVWLK